MTNPNSDEEKIAKAMRRLLNAEYLKTHIKEPLRELMPLLSDEHGLKDEFIYLVLLELFTYIDLLGYLYKGENSSRNAVEFIREYLGKIDQRYVEVGGLLYHALRHGMVHLATPKRIKLEDGMMLDFSFVAFSNKQDYLKVKKRQETEESGQLEICRLLVNLTQLYEDLLSAMDKYGEDIRHNQALSDIFWKTFETRRKPEKEEELLKKKQYIQQSDFDFVRKQISNL